MAGESIAQSVLGISERNGDASLVTAHASLTGEFLPADVLRGQLRRLEWAANKNALNRATAEQYFSLTGIQEVLDGTIVHSSVMTDWPMYQHMMQEHGQGGGGAGRSLLIGSYSALSSRAFTVMNEQVLNGGTPIITDIEGTKDMRKHSPFVQGSGLQLPYPSGSMDFVTTNRLLLMLKKPGSRRAMPWLAEGLLGEISRVLAPRGQLLMVETIGCPPDASPDEKTGTALREGAAIGLMLRKAGLGPPIVGQARRPEDTDYLFDPTRTIDLERWKGRIAFTLYATKSS